MEEKEDDEENKQELIRRKAFKDVNWRIYIILCVCVWVCVCVCVWRGERVHGCVRVRGRCVSNHTFVLNDGKREAADMIM